MTTRDFIDPRTPSTATTPRGAGNPGAARHPVVLGDWGTSRLRLYLATGARAIAVTVVDECAGPGIGALTESASDTLRKALAPWRQRYPISRVVLCGMAGSRNGLLEVPYLSMPVEPARWLERCGILRDADLDIAVGAGIGGENTGGVPDAMRGEEAQIFGALQLDPTLARGRHLLALPGKIGRAHV